MHVPVCQFTFTLLCSLPSFSARTVRLDWSHPGRPSGIMLGYEILRRTLRSCGPRSTVIASSLGEDSEGGLMLRCSYLQCPAAYGVCEVSCFDIDTQVIMIWPFHTFRVSQFCFLQFYLNVRAFSPPFVLLKCVRCAECTGSLAALCKHAALSLSSSISLFLTLSFCLSLYHTHIHTHTHRGRRVAQ